MASPDNELMAQQTEADESINSNESVIDSGHISDERGLRVILQEVLDSRALSQHAVLRIHSKEIRGHIGISDGTYICGAYSQSLGEYGLKALRRLLETSRGIYAIVNRTEQQVELKQSLQVHVGQLLTWRLPDDQAPPNAPIPALSQALDAVVRYSQEGVLPAVSLAQEDDSSPAPQSDEPTFAAWGGDIPVLSSNLSKLTRNVATKPQTNGASVVTAEILPAVLEAALNEDSDEPVGGETAGLSLPPTPVVSLPPAPPTATVLPPPPSAPAAPAGGPAIPPAPPKPPAPEAPDQLKISSSWTLDELNAIQPPAKGTAESPQANIPKASAAASNPSNTQGQAEADIDRAIRQRSTHELPVVPNLSDAAVRALVQRNAEAAGPKAFLSRSDVQQVKQSKTSNKWFWVQLVAGTVMLCVMFHQVYQVLTNAWYHKSGVSALKNGNNNLAKLEFTTLINNDPNSAQSYIDRALAETRLNDWTAAMADYDRAIEIDPKQLVAHAGKALIQIKKSNFDEAIAECDSIQSIDPKFADLYRLRAIALCNSKHYEKTIEDANSYLQLVAGQNKPIGRADVLEARAYAFYKLGNYDRATTDYTDAIALEPNNGNLRASRAMVYQKTHDWTHALEDAEKAIELNPGITANYQLRSLCYQGQGKMDEAIADLTTAVKLSPTVELHRLRAMARMAAHDYKNALEDLDYILSVSPDDREASVAYQQAKQKIAESPSRGSN